MPQQSVHTNELVANKERLRRHHALTPDVRGNHSGLTDVTFDLSSTLCDIIHTSSRHPALQEKHSGFKNACQANFLQKEKSLGSTASHLFPTQTHVKAMEISQAFVGEARAAVKAGDVGQRREVIVQQSSFTRVHIQCTVTETSCVGLEDGNVWQNIWHTLQYNVDNTCVQHNHPLRLQQYTHFLQCQQKLKLRNGRDVL